MRRRLLLLAVLMAVVIAAGSSHALADRSAPAGPGAISADGGGDASFPVPQEIRYNPTIGGMIARIDEAELYRITYDLQNFSTR